MSTLSVDQFLLERILHLSRSMAETRQLTPLLEYAMDEAMSLVGASRGYIVLCKNGNLSFRVIRGLDMEPLEDVQISTSILQEVIDTGHPLVINDAANDARWGKSKSVAMFKLRSVMCVPLISRGEAIGGIYVENRTLKGRFNEAHLTPLILFANQAAVSIENAALNDELEARVEERTRQLELAKRQVERSWMEAVQANRLRTMLLSNVAHDLRSPLSIVVSALQILREGRIGELNEEQAEWLEKSLNATKYVLDLTNDVFTLSVGESGGLTLYREEINLRYFLNDIYEIGLGLPWADDVEFRLDLPDQLPFVVMDRHRITQVLMNLLSNAMKFTTQGRVVLSARDLTEQGEVVIGVLDTGEGIPREQIDLLFHRFQQLDDNLERRQQGVGLGLAICKQLVEMHGGDIYVESTQGVGSKFEFILPVDLDV